MKNKRNRKNNRKPPVVAQWFVNILYPEKDQFTSAGDLYEVYNDIAVESGAFKARLWYWQQTLLLFPRYIRNKSYWSCAMFKNYFTIALRNIVRHKGYSFINITGLALGMACCLLIALWTLDELSYDSFHENADNLYRVEQDQNYDGRMFHVNITPYPMGPALKEEIPDIVDQTRYAGAGGQLFRYEDKAFFESGIIGVDPGFFNMFTYKFLLGDKNTALDNPNSVVLTESIAKKYFGSEDPVGKVFTLNNTQSLTVTGVVPDTPDNSNLFYNMIIPYEFLRMSGRLRGGDNWGSNMVVTYIQLHENAVVPDVNEKISVLRHNKVVEIVSQSFPDRLEEYLKRTRVEFSVMPLQDIYLYGHFGFDTSMGNIMYVYIFSIIAFFVLLIACINFMNLSTARSANRAKEVGLRKVVGALRSNLIKQFYSESVVFSVISLIFSLIFVWLFMPEFNELSGKSLTLFSSGNVQLILILTAVTVLTGLVAGSYPALFLSAFRPIKVLKGDLKSGAKSSLFRKTLVVIQFTLSIFLIIGTTVIYNQISFMQNKKLGYEKEHLLYINLRGETAQSYSAFKEELLKDTRILGVSSSMQAPFNNSANSSGAEWDGKDPDLNPLIGANMVDFDFIETMKIELAEGRSFSKEFPSDTSGSFLVNEEVAKLMGKESVVGEKFNFWGVDGTIVGVIKNYHFRSVRNVIEPHVLLITDSSISFALIRIQSEDIKSSMAYVEESWNKMVPGYPFNYTFFDDTFDSMFRTEERIGGLLKYFSILAIVIACLGLFGLASFTAEQRTKEIGIRKTLGASVSGLSVFICKEFVILVMISNVVAWPAAYYILNGWLNNFAYRTNIGWTVFASAGVLAFVIAILTVSYQAIKAARANPVDSLKYE